MAKRWPNYPRYKPNPLRPPGAGAFFDFAAGVASRSAAKLKSCSLTRRWGNAALPAAADRPSDCLQPRTLAAVAQGMSHEDSPRRA